LVRIESASANFTTFSNATLRSPRSSRKAQTAFPKRDLDEALGTSSWFVFDHYEPIHDECDVLALIEMSQH
jgi:hypothetical protein